jgi:hypothetical protein
MTNTAPEHTSVPSLSSLYRYVRRIGKRFVELRLRIVVILVNQSAENVLV